MFKKDLNQYYGFMKLLGPLVNMLAAKDVISQFGPWNWPYRQYGQKLRYFQSFLGHLKVRIMFSVKVCININLSRALGNDPTSSNRHPQLGNLHFSSKICRFLNMVWQSTCYNRSVVKNYFYQKIYFWPLCHVKTRFKPVLQFQRKGDQLLFPVLFYGLEQSQCLFWNIASFNWLCSGPHWFQTKVVRNIAKVVQNTAKVVRNIAKVVRNIAKVVWNTASVVWLCSGPQIHRSLWSVS